MAGGNASCTLEQGARAIGEIGLDQWIEGHDIAAQQDVFRFQLGIASERNLPVSIHCLRAIGPLMETLRTVELPARGIHLHAYNGPLELIPELVALGSYFSFTCRTTAPRPPQSRRADLRRARASPAD